MSLKLSIPALQDINLYELLRQVLLRAIDGSRIPIVVDETTPRVLIGATAAASANNGRLEVTGDIRIVGSGNGLILSTRDNTKQYRLIMENDGRISADQL